MSFQLQQFSKTHPSKGQPPPFQALNASLSLSVPASHPHNMIKSQLYNKINKSVCFSYSTPCLGSGPKNLPHLFLTTPLLSRKVHSGHASLIMRMNHQMVCHLCFLYMTLPFFPSNCICCLGVFS